MAVKKKKATKKQRTLAEFRAWLEGVEELQGTSWYPDADQWKLIRTAIDGIVEDAPPAPVNVEPQRVVYSAPEQHITSAPAKDNNPDLPPFPQNGYPRPEQLRHSSLPEDIEISPAAKAAMSGKLPTSMVPDASGKLKTPNIDTVNGDYNSGFE